MMKDLLGLLVLSLVASVLAYSDLPKPTGFRCGGRHQPPCTAENVCGTVNVFATGLIPTDPAVVAAGFNPAQVAAAMQQDLNAILAAGFNVKIVLVGSQNQNAIANIATELRNTSVHWTATGSGYGVRGSANPAVTFLFTDIIKLYRCETPFAPTLFSYSPNTTLVAIQREFPIPNNISCAAHPGKLLGRAAYP